MADVSMGMVHNCGRTQVVLQVPKDVEHDKALTAIYKSFPGDPIEFSDILVSKKNRLMEFRVVVNHTGQSSMELSRQARDLKRVMQTNIINLVDSQAVELEILTCVDPDAIGNLIVPGEVQTSQFCLPSSVAVVDFFKHSHVDGDMNNSEEYYIRAMVNKGTLTLQRDTRGDLGLWTEQIQNFCNSEFALGRPTGIDRMREGVHMLSGQRFKDDPFLQPGTIIAPRLTEGAGVEASKHVGAAWHSPGGLPGWSVFLSLGFNLVLLLLLLCALLYLFKLRQRLRNASGEKPAASTPPAFLVFSSPPNKTAIAPPLHTQPPTSAAAPRRPSDANNQV